MIQLRDAMLDSNLVPPDRKRNFLAWTGVLLLIALQYCLFRQFTLREIVWTHPAAFDQAGYLVNSYDLFERWLSDGFVAAFIRALHPNAPTGMMLPAQGAALYLFLGANRLTALTIVFFYFALAEVAVVWTVQWLTRSWGFAFAALFLVALSSSRFYWAGGLYDFRIDLVAASLYAVSLCLAVRSELFLSRRFTIAYACASALLILFRFVALTFVFGVLGGVFLLLGAGYIRGARQDAFRNRLINVALAFCIIGFLAAPIFLLNIKQFAAYYGTHFGPDKAVRAAELHLASGWDRFMFYPHSLATTHLGWFFFAGLAVFAGIVAAGRIASMRMPSSGGQQQASPWYDIFLAWAVLVPVVLLTVDDTKSGIIAGLLVIPLTLLAVTAAYRVTGGPLLQTAGTRIGIGALIALCIAHEVTWSAQHSPFGRSRLSELRLLEVYDLRAKYGEDAKWTSLKVIADRINDYMLPQAFTASTYERTGILYPAELTLGGTMLPVEPSRVLAAIDVAQFALLTVTNPGYDAAPIYPLDKEMIDMKSAMWERASKKMILLRKFDYNGHEMALFAKLAVRIIGESGGWLTSDGATLDLPCGVIAGKHALTMGGHTILSEFFQNHLIVTASVITAGSVQRLPDTPIPVTDRYQIRLNLSNASIPPGGMCEIKIGFDRYFVPNEHAVNSDPRKLVIQIPTDFEPE
jgi:hypothetical protein